MRILFIFSLFLSCQLAAQNLSSTLVCNAGDYFKSEKGSIEWTIGETFTESYGVLTLGFLQGSNKFRSGIQDQPSQITKEISVFPNPFNEGFQLLSSIKHSNLRIEIYDILGKLVFHQNKISEDKHIQTKDISDGIYILVVYNNDKKIGSLRINKTE